MAFALVHTVGIDDSAFGAGIQRVESRAVNAAKRTGDGLKNIGAPLRAIQGGVMAILGPIGFAVAAVTSVVGIVRTVAGHQDRLNEKVREEARLRREATQALQETLRASQIRLGIATGTPNTDAVLADIRRIDDEYEKLWSRLRDLSGSEWDRMGELLGARNRLLFVDLERAKALDRIAVAEAKIKQQADLLTFSYQQQIEALRSAGHETEALLMAEELRHIQAMEQVRKLAGEHQHLYDTLAQREQAQHERNMRSIEAEAAAARRRREEEQRERERIQAMDAEIQRRRLDAEEARANGDDRRAKEIEEEIRLMRELEEIRRTEGIDEAERARREDQARRISGARLRAIAAEEDAKAARGAGATGGVVGQRGETLGIEAGIAKTDALMRQVMGQRDPDAARWDKQTSQIDRILEYLRQSAERARSQPMLTLM